MSNQNFSTHVKLTDTLNPNTSNIPIAIKPITNETTK